MADKNPFDVELPKKSSNPFDVDIPIEKKNPVQPVSPTGTQPSKRGFEPFQSQVPTKSPSVLLSDEQKQQREKERIGERFETTLLNVPTEFGKVGQFMKSAKKVKDTLPEVPTMKPDTGGMVVIPQGEKIGESLRKGDTFQDVVTDKLTGKKTALQKQIESAQEAFRTAQGDEVADQARAQSGKEPTAFETGYENIAPLMAGIQGSVSSIYKLPRYIYNFFAIPQNLVADLGDIPGLQANYENVSKGTFNPLAYLEYAGDYTKGQEEKWQSRQRQYDEGIFDQLSNGDFAGAGLQIYDNVIGSAPSIATMFLSGGVANAAKLGSISSKIATALPFASAQSQALQDNENIPEWLKPVNAAFNGLAEILLEGRFGTTAILSGATKVIAEQGTEAAAKSIKDFAYNYIKKVLSKVQPVTDVVSNTMEEMATTLSQNIIARATGEDPNRGIMDGVADAGIVGGAQGAGASAIRKGLDIITNKKSKDKVEKLSKQRDDIVNDLDNENIPDTVKEQLEVKLEGITEELNNTLDENRNEIKNLPEESKLEIAELADKIETIKESLQNETISETSKSILEQDLKDAQAELDAKLKLAKPTFDTEEQLTEEIRAAEKEFNETGDSAEYELKINDLNTRLENLVPAPEDAEIEDIGKSYPSPAIVVKKFNPEEANELLTGEDYDYQLQRIERTIASGIKAGETAKQIRERLGANGHVFNFGSDNETVVNYIKKRIDGTENRPFQDFAKNTRNKPTSKEAEIGKPEEVAIQEEGLQEPTEITTFGNEKIKPNIISEGAQKEQRVNTKAIRNFKEKDTIERNNSSIQNWLDSIGRSYKKEEGNEGEELFRESVFDKESQSGVLLDDIYRKWQSLRAQALNEPKVGESVAASRARAPLEQQRVGQQNRELAIIDKLRAQEVAQQDSEQGNISEDSRKKQIEAGRMVEEIFELSSLPNDPKKAPVARALRNLLSSSTQKEKQLIINEIKNKLYAISQSISSKIPVQPEAPVSEEVEQGKPEAEPKVVAEEGKEEVTPTQEVKQLRAEEQAELKAAIPNADQYLTDGKVDDKKLTNDEDLEAFNKIYDKYDKLITPLLPKKEAPAPKQEAPAKAEPKLKPRVETRIKFAKAIELFNDISATKGGAKKRTLSAKRKLFLEQNPSIKYIDDNWRKISKQLEDKGLLKKEGNCP
jgi:hypothetical protein